MVFLLWKMDTDWGNSPAEKKKRTEEIVRMDILILKKEMIRTECDTRNIKYASGDLKRRLVIRLVKDDCTAKELRETYLGEGDNSSSDTDDEDFKGKGKLSTDQISIMMANIMTRLDTMERQNGKAPAIVGQQVEVEDVELVPTDHKTFVAFARANSLALLNRELKDFYEVPVPSYTRRLSEKELYRISSYNSLYNNIKCALKHPEVDLSSVTEELVHLLKSLKLPPGKMPLVEEELRAESEDPWEKAVVNVNRKKKVCYLCKEEGHIATKCPKKKSGNARGHGQEKKDK
eukprot:gene22204-8758_t